MVIRAVSQSPVIRVLLGDALAKFFLLATNIFLIHQLGVDEYSTFAVLSSAIFLGYQLACAPIERLYISEHNKYRGAIFPLLLLFSVAGGLATYTWMVEVSSMYWLVLVLGGSVTLSLYQFARIKFQQREQFFWFSLAEVVKNTLWLLGIVFYVYVFSKGHGLGSIAIILLVISAFLSWLVMISLRPEKNSDALYFHAVGWDLWRSLVGARFVIGYSVFAALMPYIPFMIVTRLESAEVIASYGAAMRYVGIVAMVGAALNAVLLPRIASMHAAPEALREFVISFIKRYLAALPLLGILVLVACWLIPYVDEGKYPLLPYIFASFSLAQVISIFSAPFVNALLVQRRAMTVFFIMVSGTLTSGLSAFLLLGFFADLAPVLGACVGYAVVALAVFMCFRSGINE